ncbi:Sodium/hydrogen exchanger [Ramaria rubella]|nr:Sodium/hydrogen exchanger [Ramaria rubella]
MGLHTQLLDITIPFLCYLCIGGFIVFFSMISLLAKETFYVGESVLATAFGIMIGPHGADVFDPRSWNTDLNAMTLEVMRITLATGVFAIGVELPQGYIAKHWKDLTILIIPSMALGWVISAGFMIWLFPSLDVVSALCISACLTPTDPILSVAITSGRFAVKHVPEKIRHMIAAESASNDGLAYPFLSISLYLSLDYPTRTVVGKWFLIGWLYEVVLGAIVGMCLGLAFCQVMKYALQKRFIDRESYVAQYIALVLLTIGLAGLIGTDDLLAAFSAGAAVAWDGHFKTQTENAVFSSVIDLVLNCGAFIYIGAWLPFESYNSPELGITPWRLLLFFLALLAFRRIPSLLLLYRWIPSLSDWKEALFTGHFGPMGVGAIYVSALALAKLPEPQMPPQTQQELLAASLHPIVSFVVLGSILIHGLSIPCFSFGRWTLTLTSTRPRSPTNPEWLTQVTRVVKPEDPMTCDEDSLEQGMRTTVLEDSGTAEMPTAPS